MVQIDGNNEFEVLTLIREMIIIPFDKLNKLVKKDVKNALASLLVCPMHEDERQRLCRSLFYDFYVELSPSRIPSDFFWWLWKELGEDAIPDCIYERCDFVYSSVACVTTG